MVSNVAAEMVMLADMPRTISTEQGLLAVGAVVLLGVILAIVSQMVQSVKLESFFFVPFLRFIYANFIKSHTGKASEGQQSALESFYAAQASIYDATRKRLLCGREDMLGLATAQLQSRMQSPISYKPVWYDIGGGTGYNIEAMDKLVGVDAFFAHVYMIDLSPSLCRIAQDRVDKFGWKNVTILCQDARAVAGTGAKADLLTMSYSLSMIPDFYSVVDQLTGMLTPRGIIGLVDFYVQSIVDVSTRNYTGGVVNRHVNWFGRMFWRTWFDADRVNLDAARRDYVEYRFGTILSASDRNYLLGGIPYHIFIGCRKEADRDSEKSQRDLERLDAALTESPYLSAQDYHTKAASEVNDLPHSKFYDSAIVNLTNNLPLPSAFYQQHHWRIHYNELLPKHQQFGDEFIYAFNWEDPKVDRQLLNITSEDVILTITSAGDNILDYLLESPKRIHAVDLNPNQNHLLELKVAAFSSLSHDECWSLFAEGMHPNFRDLLIHRLSPHLSSQAFQYWLSHTSTFAPAQGLYRTGGSRHAINMAKWLFKICNLTSKVRTFCSVETMNEQREIWPAIREVLLSWPLHYLVVSTEWFAWKAAGVPQEQRQLILRDFVDDAKVEDQRSKDSREVSGEAIWKYVVDTLDPVAAQTQISRENYFYYVCLQGRYSKRCHPRYLSHRAHTKLSRQMAFDGLRIHTDELMEVISRIAPESLTIAILMDSMDWFTPPELEFEVSGPVNPSKPTTTTGAIKPAKSSKLTKTEAKSTTGSRAAERQITALHRVLKPGGRVLFRSAAQHPWYAPLFAAQGFEVRCVGLRRPGRCIDRVNMYASAYVCTKLNLDGTVPLPRAAKLPSPEMSPRWTTRGRENSFGQGGGCGDDRVDNEDETRGRPVAVKRVNSTEAAASVAAAAAAVAAAAAAGGIRTTTTTTAGKKPSLADLDLGRPAMDDVPSLSTGSSSS